MKKCLQSRRNIHSLFVPLWNKRKWPEPYLFWKIKPRTKPVDHKEPRTTKLFEAIVSYDPLQLNEFWPLSGLLTLNPSIFLPAMISSLSLMGIHSFLHSFTSRRQNVKRCTEGRILNKVMGWGRLGMKQKRHYSGNIISTLPQFWLTEETSTFQMRKKRQKIHAWNVWLHSFCMYKKDPALSVVSCHLHWPHFCKSEWLLLEH